MRALISGLGNIVDFLKFAVKMANFALHSLIKMFEYLLAIMPKIWGILPTFPNYISTFIEITLGFAVIYMLVGRNSGKSD